MTIPRLSPRAATWAATAALTGLFVAGLTIGSYAVGTDAQGTAATTGNAALQTLPYDPPPVQQNPLANPLVVSDKTVQAECSACHMAYPAVFLPARSWHAIMSNLSDHFGEDASLDPQTTQEIANYLIANAADADPRGARIMRAVDTSATPASISEMPWWQNIHGQMVARGVFKRAEIGSEANCVACHRGAAQGYYGDD